MSWIAVIPAEPVASTIGGGGGGGNFGAVIFAKVTRLLSSCKYQYLPAV